MDAEKKLLFEIIEELVRKERLEQPQKLDRRSDGWPFLLALGNGRSLPVSEAIDEKLNEFANSLFRSSANLGFVIKSAEWKQFVRDAVGQAVLDLPSDQDLEAQAEGAFKSIKDFIADRLTKPGPREIMFGCSLFRDSAMVPFQLGPVRFESRREWLERKFFEGAITKITYRRVRRFWSGTKLGERNASFDSHLEKAIIQAIDDSGFVCSVSITNLTSDFGRDRAAMTARLALAAIALFWLRPSSALEGMNLNYDGPGFLRTVVEFGSDNFKSWHGAWSYHYPGYQMNDGKWGQILNDRTAFIGVTQRVLNYIADPLGDHACPEMLNVLALALLWFEQGCRETISSIAIVKLSAVLDALAAGSKSRGIKKLIAARLGLQESDPIRKNGPSVKAVVDELYSQGRSRLIHGTSDRFGQDWSDSERVAEALAAWCLRACFEWVAENPSCNDPKQLSVNSFQ